MSLPAVDGDSGAAPGGDPGRALWPWSLALGAAIVLALAAWTWPVRMAFAGNFFGDPGSNLTVQDLIRRGLRPTIDFVYQYGLLSLLFGRVWFALFGASPASYHASGVVFGLWTAVSLARVVGARRIGPPGAALLLVGLPYFVQSPYATFAQGLEAGLLCQALAEQSRGRRGAALALATAAVLAKPSLGYVYGLILVLLIVRDAARSPRPIRALLGPGGLGPAIATAAVGLAALAAVYGVVPVARAVVPTAGMANYRAAGFGFFTGSGRDFWRPHEARWGYYLGTVAGFWIVGSLTLVVAGAVAVRRRVTDRGGGPDDGANAEMVATCALLHAAFVAALFGHAHTWYYDSYVLGVGLACASRLGRRWGMWSWGLLMLAIVGNRSNVAGPAASWKTRPSAEIAGLWETAEGRDEWAAVLDLTRGRRWTLLAVSGCGELFSPGVEPPETYFLMPGMDGAPDIRRKADQIAGAEAVVVPTYLGTTALAGWPEFAAALRRFEVIHQGKGYRAYRRRDPAPADGP